MDGHRDAAHTAGIESETIRLLRDRVSVRKYKNEPVSDATVNAILEASFRAPTSSNIQAYSVIVVRDPALKEALRIVTGNQKHVVEAPVFLAFCADLTRMDNALQRHGHSIENNNLEIGLVSTIDAALVGMSASLVAESLGLHGVMIGAVRNDALEVARILDLPRHVYCVFGMCLGYPDEAPAQKPRMPFETMVHHDTYDPGGRDTGLNTYDKQLAAHYEAIGKPTTADSWTDDIDKKFHEPRRDKLRAALKERGFDFR